ncbi:MAG: NfeD family protein [Erysipelotrichaceae bacterium]|jgi:membrane protein implicated in regulation of membrane protease activity|nr:NfeD family protein [Erysipelotrichaceae bacterium]
MAEYMWIIWLSIFVIMLIIEASTTELVSVFFALGALIAMVISFIPGVEWWVQLIVFVVVSGATLAALRPLVKKFFNKEKRNTNVDEFIGKKLSVIDLNNDGVPEVKVNGLIWRIEGVDEEDKFNVDEKVEVVAIKGNKLVVRKVEQ